VVLGLALLGAGYGIYRFTRLSALASSRVEAHNPPAFRHRITILLLGNALAIINGKDATNPYVRDRTDTMMLVSVDPRTDQASVLSIPRDTLVDIPGVGETKINEANYFGGPKLAVRMVEKTLHVPVDYYMETTMWNFVKIINSIGGLTVDVTQPMHYGSGNSPLNINLRPGVQHLDGYQVLMYVRFRSEPLGDISRIQQQQEIVRLILKKVLTPRYIDHLPQVIAMLRQDIVYTNLSPEQMLELGYLASRLKLDQVRFATLPGHPIQRVDPYMHQTLDYWVLDERLTRLIVQEVLLDRPLTPAIRHQVHVVVKSGTESLTPAEQVAAWLRGWGFDVTAVGWANRHDHRQNMILDYTGDRYLTERLAAALGPPGATVVSESPYHDYPDLDLVITVGRDLRLNRHVVP
jgi:LCP family protein required for cell wall assembly